MQVSANVKRIADEICGLTVLEVADLHELLKKRLRIEAGVKTREKRPATMLPL